MDLITIFLSILLFLTIVLSVLGIWWICQLLLPLLHGGGPYVPTRDEDVETMLRLARLVPTDRVADLGSGDGRIVIAAAKAGVADALGIEINGALVKTSRVSANLFRLTNAHFLAQSFWTTDVSDRTVLFLYQVPHAMKRLESKLLTELPPGARVVSNDFRFVDWKPTEEHGRIRVYINRPDFTHAHARLETEQDTCEHLCKHD
ncbi:hypothetical protein EBS80_01225 [bacterium]|nr:hypothetical protein [bacterium]